MAKIKYTASLDGRIVGTRSSERTYTHAVVINGHDKTDHVATWCGRLDLAQGEQRKYSRYGFRAEIVPVAIASPRKPPIAPTAAPAAADKPELCYVAIETNAPGERIGLVKRGELGFFPTDYDRNSAAIEIVREFVAHMNDKLGVDKIEARAMMCGSMFGWNVPAANSDHQRDALAEADAIASNR